ncbi:MAG: histidine phosphatase family protein [Anaerolineae bacterium]
MKLVYLIRHGQTEWNAEGRWQGQLDVPLSSEGRSQARALAKHLAHSGIGAVYASDLMRAAETGRILAEAARAPLYLDNRLRELNLGVFQGLTHAEIRERYAEDEQQMQAAYMDHVVPRGESRRAMQRRMYDAWLEIVARMDTQPVAIVSHGGAIRILLLRLLDPLDHAQVMTLQISNTACTVLGVHPDGRVELLVAADYSHLERQAADDGEHRL